MTKEAAIAAQPEKDINRKVVLLGLIIGMFFSAMEQTVVGTAMPTIIGVLNGFKIFAWVTTAYLITSTTVIPIVGKWSDMFGRRKLYLFGIIIFVTGSGLCATATTMEQLIAYRALQGIGGGMIMPLTQTIVGDIFTAEQRARWQGVFGAIFGLSSVIGPLLGGFLVDNISWHWIFLINVPFGLLSAILLYAGLKHEIVGDAKAGNIDWPGIAVFVPALVLMLLWLSFGGDKFAWNSFTSYALIISSLILTIIFAMVETKAAQPIIDMRLFKNRVFTVTNVLGLLLGFGMFGAIMFVPMFMQGILGVSSTKAGSTMTPMMIALIIASIIGGQLLLRFRYRTVLTVGMIIICAGFYMMSTMGLATTMLTAYSYMIILGLGMGLVMPTLMIAVQNEFPKNQLGEVTSASTFFRAIGGTFGMTVLNAVMNHSLGVKVAEGAKTPQIQNDPLLKQLADNLQDKIDDLFSILIQPDLLPIQGQPKEVILHFIKVAWADSFVLVFQVGLGFLVLGVLVALMVGGGKIKRDRKAKTGGSSPAETPQA
ncbi:MAG TPA: MDR family MFS transporter [Bacilli bacterium]